MTIELKITKRLDGKEIADLMTTAFEGGIDYWCGKARAVVRDEETREWHEMDPVHRSSFSVDGVGAYANPEFWESPDRGYRLWNDDGEEVENILCRANLQGALNNMTQDYSDVLVRVYEEQYDAWDADTIVQFAVLGEIVYG